MERGVCRPTNPPPARGFERSESDLTLAFKNNPYETFNVSVAVPRLDGGLDCVFRSFVAFVFSSFVFIHACALSGAFSTRENPASSARNIRISS